MSLKKTLEGMVSGAKSRVKTGIKDRVARVAALNPDLYNELFPPVVDQQTGLFAKVYFENLLGRAINDLDEDQALCYMIMDIDNFKRFNDKYGHLNGDNVIAEVSKVIKENTRCKRPSNGDYIGRVDHYESGRVGYGEEFGIILSNTDRETAESVADRLRETIGNNQVTLTDGKMAGEKVNVTVSVGVACCSPEDDRYSLIKKADDALYKAKETGRNRVVFYEL